MEYVKAAHHYLLNAFVMRVLKKHDVQLLNHRHVPNQYLLTSESKVRHNVSYSFKGFIPKT